MVLLSTKRKVLSVILLTLITTTFLLTCITIANAQSQSVSILGIEVTQGIQSMGEGSPRNPGQDNLIPLIKNRKTWIRVYFSKPGSYRASLVVSNEPNGQGTQLKSLNNGRMVAGLGDREKLLRSSLNFEVPTSLLKGDSIVIQSIAVVNAAGSPHPRFACDNCSIYLATFPPLPLAEGFSLKLRLIGLSYETAGTTRSPTEIEFKQILSWLQRTYPVTGISLFPSRPITAPVRDIVPYDTNLGDLFEEIDGEPQGCFRANEQLRLIKEIDLAANDQNESEFEKILRTRYIGILADRGGYVRGCANGSPSVNPDIVATAPVGNTAERFKWDKDRFYGDWQVAHELGHTFGHQDPTDPKTCDAPARISPDPSNYARYVGLDFGDTSLSDGASRLQAISGDWYDFMSYCPPAAENGADTGKWIKANVYKDTLSALSLENTSMNVQALTAPPPPLGGNNTIQAIPEPRPEQLQPNVQAAHPFKVEKGRFVRALAKVDLSKGQGSLTYVRETPLIRALPSPQDQTAVQLRLTFQQGNSVLKPMELQRYPDAHSQDKGIGTAEANVPITEKPEKVELLINGTVVDTVIVSAASPPIKINKPSQSDLNALKTGKPLQLSWLPPEQDNSDVTYSIQMSYDQGRSWHTTAINLKDPQSPLRLDQASGVDNIQIRVIASNRYNSQSTVPNVPGIPIVPETILTIPGIHLKQHGPHIPSSQIWRAPHAKTKVKTSNPSAFKKNVLAIPDNASRKHGPKTQ